MGDLEFAHETRIRDTFAERLQEYRPHEHLLGKELTYEQTGARVDMRTIDAGQIIREWEFKIEAGYSALGQILVYVALARKDYGSNRTVRGVLAAFDFAPKIVYTIEAMNLGIELYRLPIVLRSAGVVPRDGLAQMHNSVIPIIPVS